MKKLILTLALFSTSAMAANDIVMHRDPGCGCCEKWAVQVRQKFGRAVKIVDDANRAVTLVTDGFTSGRRSSTASRLKAMFRLPI